MREFAKAIITAPFLQAKIDEYFDKRATARPNGASPGSGRPVWIVVLLVLAVVAVIAIVVTYWVEILFAGLAVLAFHASPSPSPSDAWRRLGPGRSRKKKGLKSHRQRLKASVETATGQV
jgi:hypothetical protein